MGLKGDLVRLAYQQEHLRGDLLPLLGVTAAKKYYWAARDPRPVEPGFVVPPARTAEMERHKELELIFERVRKQVAPGKPSRIGAIYVCPSLEGFCRRDHNWSAEGGVYEVAVQGKTFLTNASYYTEAIFNWERQQDVASAERWAKQYWEWKGKVPKLFFAEVIVQGKVTVLRRVDEVSRAAATRPRLPSLVLGSGKQASILAPPRRGSKGKIVFVRLLLKKLAPLATALQGANLQSLSPWREMFDAAGAPLVHLRAAADNLNNAIKQLRQSLSTFEKAEEDSQDQWDAWYNITKQLQKPLFGAWGVEDATSKAVKALQKLLRDGAPSRGSQDPKAKERLSTLETIRDTLDPSTISKEDMRSLGDILKFQGDSEIADYFQEMWEEYDNPLAYQELSDLWKKEIGYATSRAQKGMAEAEGPDWNPDRIPAREMAALETFNRLAQEAQTLVEQAEKRTQNQSSEQIPESEDQEQVYHASIHARQLFQNGFAKDVPDQEGLGGSQSTKGDKKGTSFTYDLYVAKEIARTLKELTMVVQGKVTARMILDWAKRDRVAEKLAEQYDGYLTKPYELRFETGGWVLQDNRGNFEMPDKVFNTPLKRASLYKEYLRVIGLLSKRYDPYVMHLNRVVPVLAKANIQNIGVVVATVDMTNPHIEHKPGERELRIPPEAIISVDKFF